ncbi:MAG: ABC transporter ATP-binding protein [Bacteroidetes bacterium]|jgi:peptide/nickel transport system ATP-binding protein|nr:ABC transporter ATP-binding protein [Bacteroidota bacterium]
MEEPISQSTGFSLLKVKGLQISFFSDGKWQQAVCGIDFSVDKGKTLGIVGESGSGKSVSSLALMRLLDKQNSRVEADEILFKGQSLLNYSERQMRHLRGKNMAMIFQEPMTSLNPVFRCGDQVAEALRVHENLSKHEARERVLSLFQQVQLPRPEAIYRAYPHQISGGQKQRVMIAMAISCKPDLLIADEPTTALDVTVQKDILLLLKSLQKQYGMGMIFITHDLAVIAELADDVAVMHQGKIVEQGPVNNLLENPQHPYTKGLLACRPPLKIRLKRLPVVREFMEGRWDGGAIQIQQELQFSDQERKLLHEQMYLKQPILTVDQVKAWFPLRKGLLGRTYDHVKAVDNVSFEVFPGETLGLVGESGCGKTTLGRALLRLQELNGGQITFKGQQINLLDKQSFRKMRKHIQIIFQDPYSSLNPRMSIGNAIAEPILVHRLARSAKERREKVITLLEEVGLGAEHYDRYPHEFSGGQRQRISIARALAVEPELIICDESVSALDVSVQAQVLNLLNRLKAERGLTYIFISHDLGVVRFMSDRILVMKDGHMEELAEADTLFQQPQSDYTKKLIEALPGIKFFEN